MKFGDLRGILQYVPQFRGRTFVVALDGGVLARNAFSDILLDLAVLRSLNIRVVLVHGGAQQIRALAEKRGVTLSNDDGIGPTDEATLEVCIDAISRLSSDVMQKLSALKIRAASANVVFAHPAGIRGGVDFQHTGSIERVDVESLEALLDQEILPIVSPLGYDSSAGTLRVNSDEAAMEIGTAIKADKIIFVVEKDLDPLIEVLEGRQLTSKAAAEQVAKNRESGEWCVSKIAHAVDACEAGVPRTHLISIEQPDALLAELFSNAGVGIMVSDDFYQRFRRADATDVDELMTIMRRAVDSEKLVRRSREDLLSQIEDFILLEIDGNVVGCVAVHPNEENEDCAEIACLYVKRTHDGLGYGRKLLAEAERRANEIGANRVFALSTQAIGFFERCGFSKSDDTSVMPVERLEKWKNNGRNAALLVK
ncbi:MAG: amino-acid N-acetyltransferase [Verrucomicrobiales bacterium]|nr:amino-acid N-acetyltransferase [Verrucomicrobiales bacterium]